MFSKTNSSLAVAFAFVLLATFLFGGFFKQPTQAQPPAAAQAPTVGRYQMFVKSGSENTAVFVMDSTTGQCWYRDTNPGVKEWTDMGVPAVKGKK